jgi:hypothetical protein
MAAAILPIRNNDQRVETTSNSAPKAALERRQSERAIADREKETMRLGRTPTLMTLNTADRCSRPTTGYAFSVSAATQIPCTGCYCVAL